MDGIGSDFGRPAGHGEIPEVVQVKALQPFANSVGGLHKILGGLFHPQVAGANHVHREHSAPYLGRFLFFERCVYLPFCFYHVESWDRRSLCLPVWHVFFQKHNIVVIQDRILPCTIKFMLNGRSSKFDRDVFNLQHASSCVKHVLLMSVIVFIALGVGTVYSQQPEIPSWIKSIADLWADDKTSDEEFVSALEFLINADVIQVDNTVPLDDYNALYDDYNVIYDDYDALVNDYNMLYDDYDALVNDYNMLYDDYGAIYPITTISGTEVSWEFYDSKGNYYKWSMPIVTYENLIQPSRDYSLYQTYDNPKYINLNGRNIPVPNFDGFVGESFSEVIDGIYDNSYDDSDFIYEVWYVVSQLTVYDEDVTPESEGRFALETFTRTGGDCEDLVILIADMLMSSGHTRHWKLQYVMMDSDNPLDPQDMNHVVLHVEDGQYGYYIEATGPPSWDYYPDGVNGWWFDVV